MLRGHVWIELSSSLQGKEPGHHMKSLLCFRAILCIWSGDTCRIK